MLKLKDLIKSSEIIDMVYKYSGKEWSLSYFNIKKNFKDFLIRHTNLVEYIYGTGKILKNIWTPVF